MPRPYVRVQHLEDGGVVGTFLPLQPRFAFRANDPGDITYELALSNPAVMRDAFAPKRTEWRLQVSHNNTAWRTIQAGFHWPVALNNEEGTVKIQGVDWMAYLEQPMWFDIYTVDAVDLIAGKTAIKTVIEDPASYARVWTQAAGTDTDLITYGAVQQTVVQELVDSIAHGNDGTINIDVTFAGDGSGWAENMNYVIMFQDETTILDHIRAISDMDSPFGFDYFMTWDKTLVCYNPTRTAPIDAINTLYSITRATRGLVSVQWQNNGPMATHTVAVAPGSPGIWAQKTFAPSVDTYGRWLRLAKLGGSYRMPEEVLAAVNGIPDRFPQKELKITIKPDELIPTDPIAFFTNLVGEAIYVDIDFPPYHRINANFWIVGQEFSTDDVGNWLCDVSLQQIYDPSGVG